MAYIVNLAKELTDLNFELAENMCDSPNITELSKYVFFHRQEGHIFYGVRVINCDLNCDYKAITELTKKSVENIPLSKIIINIYLSSSLEDELIGYTYNDIEDYNAGMIIFKWLVDIKNEKTIVLGSQPNDILRLRRALTNSFEHSANIRVSSDELKNQQAANIQRLIKSNKCYATYCLMVLNFIFWSIMYTDWGASIVDAMCLDKQLVYAGEYYRLFTYMFTHGGAEHFVCNTFSLFIIGSRLEKFSSSFKFTLLYIISGIIAGCTSCIAEPAGIAVGASGAIFGIIGGLIYMIKKTRHNIGGFDYSVAIVFAAIGVFSGFFMPNIDNFAHIGGLIGGLLASVVLRLEK